MDLPYNMAVFAPSLSIFLLSQFLTAPPNLPAPTLVYRSSPGFISSMTSVSLDLFMGLWIFAFASVVLSLIAFSLSIVLVPPSWGERSRGRLLRGRDRSAATEGALLARGEQIVIKG
jgi:hypothetical protein